MAFPWPGRSRPGVDGQSHPAWFTRLPIRLEPNPHGLEAAGKDGKPPSDDFNPHLPGDESPGWRKRVAPIVVVSISREPYIHAQI